MKLNVLVVDNNPVLLKAISSLLTKEGCNVEVATNGLEALEKLQNNIPDIVFTDLVMPLVDGEQLCKIIKEVEKYQNIFVVILSAILVEDKKRILSEIDCDVYIAKGSLREIKEHLREAIYAYNNKIISNKKILGDTRNKDKDIRPSITRELLLEKQHLLSIFENLSEGIVELSSDGKVVSVNRATISILNSNTEDLIAQKYEDLEWGNHSEVIKKWCCTELVNKGGGNLEILESDPLILDEKVITASFLPVIQNESCFGISILRDITRQYLAEKEKEEADNALKLVKKMDAMSCMAGGVAHDFNNLLTVLCGNLDMITMDDTLDEETRENFKNLQNARESAYSAVELVRKISNFSPFGIVQRSTIYLDKLVKEVALDSSHDQKGKKYKFETLEKDILVNIDSSQLKIAIQNILKNAVESGTEHKLVISVESETVQEPQILSGQYLPSGDYGKVVIRDQGRGIKAEHILEVFDPYFSTKERGVRKGMGLGLTIVYSTLRNHGGYVILESEEHKGTSVSLYLPVELKTETEQEKKREGYKILLVEGDDELRTISKIMLEHLKLIVISAKNTKEALQYLTEAHNSKGKISAALLNLSEEKENDGVETCVELRKIDSDLKVIIASASIFDPVMRDCRAYGFTSTLVKPYNMDDLKKAVSSL